MNGQGKKTETLWLTSIKGGVGVSFSAANLALALSRRGARVLLIDANPLCRSLDTVFSCEEDVVYDIRDAAEHRAPLDRILLQPLGKDGPYLLPGAFSSENALSPNELSLLLRELSREAGFDYILTDAPATEQIAAVASVFDRILVFTDTSSASLRAAEMSRLLFGDLAEDRVFLVINRFSLLPPRESGQEQAILMLDAAKLPLLGILPTVGELSESTRRYVGRYPLLNGRAFRGEPALFAFDNLAARLVGERVPLLSNIRAVRAYRRKLLYR